MADLALAAKLFAGKIIYFALEAPGTSDLVTKPISGSALWLALPGITSADHKTKEVVEEYDEVDANIGWAEGKDVYTTADYYMMKSRYTTAMFEQLRYGLASAIVQGTPQTPMVRSDRKLRGWLNAQERMSNGQDRHVVSLFGEIRAVNTPPSEKKTQETEFEFWVKYSTLQSINWPT